MEELIERRLYFISDTHHELLSNKGSLQVDIIPIGTKHRNFLALCGDIGNPFEPKYEEFIRRHAERFERIFIISGNHEYYSNQKQRPIAKIDNQIKLLAEGFPNVHFLQKTTFQVEDTLFLGCTLWTKADEYSQENMNDYRRIYTEDDSTSAHFKYINGGSFFGGHKTLKQYIRAGRRLITYMDVYSLHCDMKDWLETTLNNYIELIQNKVKKAIVLTHHAPSFQMLDGLKHDERFANGYASDCTGLFKEPLVAWISGHTHECKEILINKIPSMSNCLGYSNQRTGCNLQKYVVF